MLKAGVSVVMCCYNSTFYLKETLKHLANQKVPRDIPWEIILIDNASTDNTFTIARDIWDGFKVPDIDFITLEEKTPGKNFAFERGINTAKYDYLLTCDDDNWLSENYVTAAFDIMNADTTIGALGGLGIVEAEQPTTLTQDELNQLTVHGPQTWAATDHWVYGAGSVYRTSILKELKNKGWQQITTGRIGKKLISGEDVELCFMIYLSGYKIFGDDRLTFKHFIALKKQHTSYSLDMAFGLSYSYFLLHSYLVIINHEQRPLNKIIKGLLFSHFKSYIKQRLKFARPSIAQQKKLLSDYGMIRSILANRDKVIAHNKHLQQLLKDNAIMSGAGNI